MSIYTTMRNYLVKTYSDYKMMFTRGSPKVLINGPLSPEDAVLYQQHLKEDGWFEVIVPGYQKMETSAKAPKSVAALENFLMKRDIIYKRTRWYGCVRAKDVLHPETADESNDSIDWCEPRGYTLFEIEGEDGHVYDALPWVKADGRIFVLAQATTYRPAASRRKYSDIGVAYFNAAYLCGQIKGTSNKDETLGELNNLLTTICKKPIKLELTDIPVMSDFTAFIHSLTMMEPGTSYGAAVDDDEEWKS